MPSKNPAAGTSRRGGPQFKPPRPVKPPAQPAATAKPARPASNKAAAVPAARPNPRPEPAIIVSSSDEHPPAGQHSDRDGDDWMQHTPARPASTRPSASAPAPPPISAPLLARLLQQNFESENTQIQKGALTLVAKYVDIFVREAFARAKNEREAAVKGGGVSDGFLQVEDLEKLAPQLVLDF